MRCSRLDWIELDWIGEHSFVGEQTVEHYCEWRWWWCWWLPGNHTANSLYIYFTHSHFGNCSRRLRKTLCNCNWVGLFAAAAGKPTLCVSTPPCAALGVLDIMSPLYSWATNSSYTRRFVYISRQTQCYSCRRWSSRHLLWKLWFNVQEKLVYNWWQDWWRLCRRLIVSIPHAHVFNVIIIIICNLSPRNSVGSKSRDDDGK